MGGEQLEKQIDTKKDAIIEEKELLDFIKDEKNVQEL